MDQVLQGATVPLCVVCQNPAVGFSRRAGNVKCDTCRKTRSLLKCDTTDGDLIFCRECGVQRLYISGHVRSVHGLTREQYSLKHPDAPWDRRRPKSEECKAKIAEAARRRWADPNARAVQSAKLLEVTPLRGRSLSEAHKLAMSKKLKGQKYAMTDKGKTVHAEQGRQVFKALHADPGYGARQSEAMIRRAASDPEFGFRNSETKRKSLASRIQNGTLIPPGGGRGITGFRQGIAHYCRSTMEANLARVLVAANVSYSYEPKVVLLPSGARWTPDFFLHEPLKDLLPAGWIECKGWRMPDGSAPGKAGGKIREFEKASGTPVFLLCQSDLLWHSLERAWKPQIFLWETARRNLKTHPALFGLAA